MDIRKYGGYFHDGELISVKHDNGKIELFISSAEVDPEDLEDAIPLDINDCITGILHIENINNIYINNTSFSGELKMKYPNGGIADLTIERNSAEIVIAWGNRMLKQHRIDYSKIRIEAEKIYWENKPDLYDPTDY